MLKVESLESRTVPAVLFSEIAEYYADAGTRMATVFGSDPGVDVVVGSVQPAPNGPVYDVYAASVGGGPRVVLWDSLKGEKVADLFAFEEQFRGGIESVESIGSTVYVTPAFGGGPVVCAFDVLSGDFSHFAVDFPSDWRGGVKLAVGDVDRDAVNELLVLPGSSAGAHFLALDAATGAVRLDVHFQPTQVVSEWEWVPAGVVSGGVLVQPEGSQVNEFNYVPYTVFVPFDTDSPSRETFTPTP